MTLNPELIPIEKDKEVIRIDVLTNIIKILNARGYINNSNLAKSLEEIKKQKDDDIYLINLQKNINPESDAKEYVKNFIGKQVAVKIIHQKIQGVAKVPIIKDFINEYKYYHKIFVFDDISDKAKSYIIENFNTEVFVEVFLMINIIDHIDSPRYELLTENEEKEVLESYILKKKEMKKILTTDPIVLYFNLKRGNIIRIIRPSEQSGEAVDYRIVAKGSS
jgi:DNA-directed RNA polymerase subunit H (RpoH/RPB5)